MKRDYGLVNLQGFMEQLTKNLKSAITVNKSWGSIDELYEYNKNSQIFNRRLQLKPFVIVYCENADDVQVTFNAAVDNNLPFRVRAGGHDHEGECSGTNTVLIDVSKMHSVEYTNSGSDTIAKVGPGCKFEFLTSELASHDVMIPHGTCATVGISGFTQGGGWGPYTRLHGMCCESLVGADILLGNGEIESIDATVDNVPDLLWALRGGGGMSYGIVTEFRFKTFVLPDEMYRFEVEWNDPEDQTEADATPTLEILKNWENSTSSDNTLKLMGTNLKINGIPLLEDKTVDESVAHSCIFYGYWNGDKGSLTQFVQDYFKTTPDYCLTIELPTGARYHKTNPYGKNMMGTWGRESLNRVRRKLGLDGGTPLQPDEDIPAPHKLTSRLVDGNGLSDDGRMKLLESLSSPLIIEGNRELGLFTYVTLGAITGNYYQNDTKSSSDSAFPYEACQYTIQYQCWWNEEEYEKNKFQNNNVYNRVNKALDWIETCRNADIPNTYGAFISFKDNSIPTETYFDKNYDLLQKIKWSHSKDPLNHFRTRKTVANMIAFIKDKQSISRINAVTVDSKKNSATISYSTADLRSNSGVEFTNYTLSIFEDLSSPVDGTPLQKFEGIHADFNGTYEMSNITPELSEGHFTIALSVGSEVEKTLCAYVCLRDGVVIDSFNENITLNNIEVDDQTLTFVVQTEPLPGKVPDEDNDLIMIYDNTNGGNKAVSVTRSAPYLTSDGYITRLTINGTLTSQGQYSIGYYCGNVLGACSSKEYIATTDISLDGNG